MKGFIGRLLKCRSKAFLINSLDFSCKQSPTLGSTSQNRVSGILFIAVVSKNL